MSKYTDITLICTDRYLLGYAETSDYAYRVTGSRAALAQFVACEYGFTFATRFMRNAREVAPATWLFPAVPAIGRRADRTGYRLLRDANAAKSAIAVIVAHADGRRGKPLLDHRIAVERKSAEEERA